MSVKIFPGEPALWQWDIGRRLVVDDTVCCQVHFNNGTTEEALAVEVHEQDGQRWVNVPNILLQSARNLIVYTYKKDSNGAQTRQSQVFPVYARRKPADYVYTETEVLTYHALEERLKELEGEGLAKAVESYLKENPAQAGATAEEAAQIQQNKTDIEQLAQGKLDTDKLPEAVNEALAQAKTSGEFKGDPGEPGQPGEPGKTPVKGEDYFTDADKQEIAEQAAKMVEVPEGGSGLTTAQINALDNMFKVCAFTKADISAEYNAFCAAFGIEGGIVPDEPDTPVEPDEPEVTLTSISATYSGGDVAVGTAVTDLTGIVVTAHYSDGSQQTVTGYTLSGTIAEGNNTITVTYQGKTATFTVTGVADSGGDESATNGWEDGVPYVLDITETGKYVKTSDGTIADDANYSVTDYLPCHGASTIVKESADSWGNYNGFYDENKAFISNFMLSAGTKTVNVPENAWYVRFSSRTTAFANAVIVPHA